MSENTVVITEKDGKYRITNDGIPELTLLGILECIVFEMKSAPRRELPMGAESAGELREEAEKPVSKEPASEPEPPSSDASELQTRIGNAVKAIRGLGGEASEFDVLSATDEELREELAALTEQYKRLKTSRGEKK